MYDVERHVVILGLLLRSEMGLFSFVSNYMTTGRSVETSTRDFRKRATSVNVPLPSLRICGCCVCKSSVRVCSLQQHKVCLSNTYFKSSVKRYA